MAAPCCPDAPPLTPDRHVSLHRALRSTWGGPAATGLGASIPGTATCSARSNASWGLGAQVPTHWPAKGHTDRTQLQRTGASTRFRAASGPGGPPPSQPRPRPRSGFLAVLLQSSVGCERVLFLPFALHRGAAPQTPRPRRLARPGGPAAALVTAQCPGRAAVDTVLSRLCHYCKPHGHEGRRRALCGGPDGDCAPEPRAGCSRGLLRGGVHLRTTDPAQEPAARLLPNPTTEGFPSRVASRTSPPRADGGRVGAADPQRRDAPRLAGSVGGRAQATPCAPQPGSGGDWGARSPPTGPQGDTQISPSCCCPDSLAVPCQLKRDLWRRLGDTTYLAFSLKSVNP